MAGRPVQNAPGFEVQPQTRAAAMSMQNKAMMKDWERQKNASKRNPIGSFKKGGQSAPLGTSSNEDVISKRLDKLKSYVEENVTGSMLKDEQEE